MIGIALSNIGRTRYPQYKGYIQKIHQENGDSVRRLNLNRRGTNSARCEQIKNTKSVGFSMQIKVDEKVQILIVIKICKKAFTCVRAVPKKGRHDMTRPDQW